MEPGDIVRITEAASRSPQGVFAGLRGRVLHVDPDGPVEVMWFADEAMRDPLSGMPTWMPPGTVRPEPESGSAEPSPAAAPPRPAGR